MVRWGCSVNEGGSIDDEVETNHKGPLEDTGNSSAVDHRTPRIHPSISAIFCSPRSREGLARSEREPSLKSGVSATCSHAIANLF